MFFDSQHSWKTKYIFIDICFYYEQESTLFFSHFCGYSHAAQYFENFSRSRCSFLILMFEATLSCLLVSWIILKTILLLLSVLMSSFFGAQHCLKLLFEFLSYFYNKHLSVELDLFEPSSPIFDKMPQSLEKF